MFELGQAALGDRWIEEVHAMNSQAPTVLRVNTLKTDRKILQKALKDTNP